MNLRELRKLLDDLEEMSGTDKMLVRVAIPNDPEELFSGQSPEPLATVQTYTHLDIDEVSVTPYRDSGQTDWVVYLSTKEQ